MEKIVITGGAGFIGSEIVDHLNKIDKYEISVIDCMAKQIHGDNWEKSYLYNKIKGKCNFVKADIRDLNAIKDTIISADYIIHLASETGTGQSMYQINHYNDVNVMGTSNILQAISSGGLKSKVKKIILSSSRAIYGEGKYSCPYCGTVYPSSRKKERMEVGDFGMYCDTCGSKLNLVPTTEDSTARPNSLYAFTKYAQEIMIQTMCPALDVKYTIFRFQNVYGEGQSLNNPYTGILSIFSNLLLENKSVNIFEDGMESRDFINVKDIADGVCKALIESQSDGEIINLGSGVNTSVIEIAKLLKAAYKSTSNLNITGDFRIGDIAHNVADIEKAKKILGFKPQISLKDGLDLFCSWVKEQEIGNNKYESSLIEMEKTGMFIRKKE